MISNNYKCSRCGNRNRSIKHNVCLKCRTKDLLGKRFGGLIVLEAFSKGRVKLKCDCGKTFIANRTIKSNMQVGKATSCGCRIHYSEITKRSSTLSYNTMAYSTRRSDAKRRLIQWEITKEYWNSITMKPCHYCGTEKSNRIKGRIRRDGSQSPDYLYNGIDRVNNDIGYTINNCVPCCKNCNFMKRKLSVEEFFNHIKKICKHSKL